MEPEGFFQVSSQQQKVIRGDYRKGDEISGLPQSAVENEKVFLAGVAEQEGKLVTNGGRVLCVTALGESVFEAQQKALKLAEQIQWSGRFYRRDIGLSCC